MDINQLIAIIKKKIVNQFVVDSIDIEDKSFLHKNHSGNQPGKYHLKIKIRSA
jgi:BolA family transcriptional regulator, general stress-responsive regulator